VSARIYFQARYNLATIFEFGGFPPLCADTALYHFSIFGHFVGILSQL